MISEKVYQRYASDPSSFRNDLQIEVDGTIRRLGDVLDDWQEQDFAKLDPGLLKCVGRSDSEAKLRAYFERARGHSKTTDIAVTCVWLLVFATRPVRGYSYAADRDQAALLRDAVDTIVRLNPWIGEILKVSRSEVENVAAKHPGEGSRLKIETSDVASSYGILPDFIVADEFTHWQGDGGLWNSLISSAAKKANCLLLGISNAGFVDSWQWKIREAIRTDDAWIFSRLDGPQASWMSADRLEEQKRMLPAVAYRRLWLNEWSSGGGDALQAADIKAAFNESLTPMTGSAKDRRDFLFVAGVDLGLTRDCSSIVTLAFGKHGSPCHGQVRLAEHKVWKPVANSKVDLISVESYLRELDRRFSLNRVAFDPWQAEMLAQRIEDTKRARSDRWVREPFMREVPPTGSNLRDQASLVIESFNDRRFKLYPCEPLRRDLHRLRVEEKSYGYRLTSPRDAEGHGDTFSAFALALLVGHEEVLKKPAVIGIVGYEGDPFERAIARFEREKELRQQEWEMFQTPDVDEFHNLRLLGE